MKKITVKAVNAFMNDINFREGNTVVTVNKPFSTTLSLFGNDIASKRNNGQIYICNRGFFTNTTKERLNGIPGVDIRQKAGKWYLNGTLWDGKLIKIN